MKKSKRSPASDVSRRHFLAATTAGVGGLMLTSQTVRGAEGEFFDPAELVPLGKSGLKTSRVGFGTGAKGWMRQSNQTKLGKESFQALLRYAYDQGIRLFDMADLYGTHPFLIPALKDLPRKDYTIVSKVWTRKGGVPEAERPTADVCVERFLKELATDYIDIVQIHCVMDKAWPTEVEAYMEALEKLKQKGTIRAHGVSVHAIPGLETAAVTDWVDVVHTRINPFGASMDGPAEKVVPALRKIHEAGKGVIGMKIIGEGAFRNDEEKKNQSIEHALTCGCVSAMIVGFEKKEEIDDFSARVRKVKRP
jgi:aryl-alcohol dehydrogenase-like predicted oxidoreductase